MISAYLSYEHNNVEINNDPDNQELRDIRDPVGPAWLDSAFQDNFARVPRLVGEVQLGEQSRHQDPDKRPDRVCGVHCAGVEDGSHRGTELSFERQVPLCKPLRKDLHGIHVPDKREH